MSYDRALLKASFKLLLEREPHIPRHFYEVLFKLHPDMAPLFHSRTRQEAMLAKTLVAIMDRVDDAPWLDEQLALLGKRHQQMPIKPEMWDWFRDSLMITFEEIAGPEWTPEIEAAWTIGLADITAKVRKATESTA